MRWQRRRRRCLQLAHDELVAAEPISMTALILSSICSAGPAHELSQSGHLARACRTVKIQCSHESDRKVQHVFFRVAVLQLRHRTGAPGGHALFVCDTVRAVDHTRPLGCAESAQTRTLSRPSRLRIGRYQSRWARQRVSRPHYPPLSSHELSTGRKPLHFTAARDRQF